MRRLAFLLFSLAAYLLFMLTFAYLIGFVAGWNLLPRSIDRPLSSLPWPLAVILDFLLIAIFGLQHSVMARPAFKAMWQRYIPAPIERSGYVLATCLALALLFAAWQPLGPVLWDVRNTAAELAIWPLYGAGWMIVITSSYLIDHLELFGLAQPIQQWRGMPTEPAGLQTPLFYKLVRHPLYAGFLLAFWATPKMTTGHLIFTLTLTLYVLVAIVFEERDLVTLFGSEYEHYQRTVGKLLPRLNPVHTRGKRQNPDETFYC